MSQHQPCVQRKARMKTRKAIAGEKAMSQKKPFGLAQLSLRVSRAGQPVSQRDPSLKK